MSHATLQLYLGADVADGGTFTTGYPDGTSRGDFVNGAEHRMVANQTEYSAPENFTVSFGATTVTVTWNGGYTLSDGTRVRMQYDMPGSSGELVDDTGSAVENTVAVTPVLIDLGNPAAADVDTIALVQLAAGAGDMTLSGASVVDDIAVLDVPRNVTLTVATTNHSARTFTVYGADAYGEDVVETIAGPNANTVAGKKAFKTVTRVAVDGALATNGVSVGFGDVLGLPVHLPITGLVVKEIEDSAIATAGTLVAGLSVLTKPTASNADVRGTYDPNSACDGSKSFQLIALLPDPAFKGQAQYAG
ncbi:hypothetical protein [Mycolicibacterium sp.]|uniref:hypothetical protein n=1 Tax=Mycolicibacterium sp. TaxID=2320850 RepID=UPI00355E8FD6